MWTKFLLAFQWLHKNCVNTFSSWQTIQKGARVERHANMENKLLMIMKKFLLKREMVQALIYLFIPEDWTKRNLHWKAVCLMQEKCEVHVITGVEMDEELPRPLLYFTTIGEVIGKCIAWPLYLIVTGSSGR